MRPLSGPILTAAEMRAAEAAAVGNGVTLYDLMERAGAAVAEAVWRFGGGRPTLILCGPGNNGGDGYVVARLLRERGLDVRLAASREPRAPEAIEARSRWTGPVEPLADAEPEPVLVDALFGTGLARALESETRAALERLADAAKFVIAIDLPSGLGTDDGADLGAVAANLTLALGSLKPAHCLHPGAAMCGAVRVGDIGIAASSATLAIAKPQLQVPAPDSHKYRRGYAVIVGGRMGGAAMLAARAAMPLAGYVGLVGGRRQGPDALVAKRWDDVADDARVGAMLLGPGLGRDDAASESLARVLATPHPLVLDADALMLLEAGAIKKRGAPVILTPHAGEFAKLFGDGKGSKIDRTRAAAALCGATVVFKGADTAIAAPDGRVAVATGAPGWLASAGTGDVLAGMVAARLSAGGDPFDATCEAVWLHAEAARLAGPALTADHLPAHIPAAVAACL